MAFNFSALSPDELPSPLVLLSPQEVHDVLISTYLHLGTLSVLVWDVINNLRNDWRLLCSFKLGVIPTSAYFTSRMFLLLYSIGRAVILTHPIGNCTKFQNMLNSCLIIFIASTTFLFYVRACTIYSLNKAVVTFYGVLWLAVVGMAGTFSITFTAQHIGSTSYCREYSEGTLLGPSIIVQLVNEVFLYVGIGYRVYKSFALSLITKETLDPLLWSTTLTTIAKFALLESHLYCLGILVTKIFLVSAIYAFNSPINTAFIIPHLILTNIWSGRIYRNFRKMRKLNEVSCMISQTEFELRIGRRIQPTMGFGEETCSPEFEAREPQGNNAADSKHVVDADLDQSERTSTIVYTSRRAFKTSI